MHNFKELKAWKNAGSLAKLIYVLSSGFPREEKFGLVSELRRATISISSNVAEGCERSTNKDIAQFLNISLGSAYEVESHLYLSFDLNFIDQSELEVCLQYILELQQMIFGLVKTLRQ